MASEPSKILNIHRDALAVRCILNYIENFKTPREEANGSTSYSYGGVGQCYEVFYRLACMVGAYDGKRYAICDNYWKPMSQSEVLASYASNVGDGGIDIRMIAPDGKKIRVQGKLFYDDLRERVDKNGKVSHRSIDDYGVSQLLNDIKAVEGDDHHFILLVNNEDVVRMILKGCRHPRKVCVRNVVGIRRLQDMWNRVLELHSRNELLTDRIPVVPRPHQIHAIRQIELRYQTGETTILLAHLPRAGKTITVLYFIARNSEKYKRIIISTPIPTETAPSFVKWLTEMSGFEGYKVVNQQDSRNTNPRVFEAMKGERVILITSAQWLKDHYDEIGSVDLVVSDEHDFYSSSAISQNVFNHFEVENKDTKFFFMTATAMKAIEAYNIPSSCIFYWTLEDNSDMRLLTSETRDRIIERQGADFGAVLDEYPDPGAIYREFPVPVVEIAEGIFNQLTTLQKRLEGTELGYNLSQLGLVGSDRLVRVLLASIFGIAPEVYFRDGIGPEEAILKRAQWRYKQKYGTTRTKWQIGMWLSRGRVEGEFLQRAEFIKSIIEQTEDLRGYKVLIIHGGMMNKKQFKKQVDELYRKSQDGVIILACQMGRRGISFEDMDMTILLDQTQSLATYVQTVMRCLTEKEDKHFGFIVDFYETRVIDLVASLADTTRCRNQKEKMVAVQTFMANCMSVNTGMFTSFREYGEEFIAQILERQEVLINAYRSQALTKLLSDDDYPLDSIFVKAKINSPPPPREQYSSKDGSEQLPSGVKGVKTGEKVRPAKVLGLGPARAPIRRHDPLTDVLRLAILLCDYAGLSAEENIVSSLEALRDDHPGLAYHFRTLVATWNAEIGDQALEELIKLLRHNNNFQRADIIFLVRGYRFRFQQLDDLYERHRLVCEFLPKSTAKEVELFGGINTSLAVVERLLAEAPIDWTNPELRFLEPGCGYGPWSLVAYQKLMTHLPIEDEEERRTHVLEKMLHFNDIQERNITVIQLVFGPHYDIALNCEDFLRLPCTTKFDVILGNPPFACAGHSAAWKDFTTRILQEWLRPDGVLVFVNPSTWRQPAKVGSLNYGYFEYLAHQHQLVYLETGAGKGNQHVKEHDYFVLVNRKADEKTKYVSGDEPIQLLDLQQHKYLSDDISLSELFFAKNGEPTLKTYTRSGYGSRTDSNKGLCDTKRKGVVIVGSWTKGDMDELPHYICTKSYGIYSTKVQSTSGEDFYTRVDGPMLNSKQVDQYMYKVIGCSGRHFRCRTPEPGTGVAKVIVVSGSEFKVPSVMDWSGEFGVSEHGFCVVPESEPLACELYQWLQYPSAQQKLLKTCKYSTRQFNETTLQQLSSQFWKKWDPTLASVSPGPPGPISSTCQALTSKKVQCSRAATKTLDDGRCLCSQHFRLAK